MRKKTWISAAAVIAGAVAVAIGVSLTGSKISRDSLVSDVRQFATTVESVHPDPYRKMGGRIEFHRRLQKILEEIPESGMSREDFYCLLCPFVTGIGDSHTWLRPPDEFSYGLPLYLGIVSEGLFVGGVPSETYRHLLGARLTTIEGIPVQEIIQRARSFVSAENEYQILRNLGGAGMLYNKWFLDRLIPACRGRNHVNVTLLQRDGASVNQTLECAKYTDLNSYVWLTSQYSLPSRDRSDFVYSFTDSSRQTALLVIDDLNTYREAFEMWRHDGRFGECASDAAAVYRRYNSSDPPKDEETLIAGLPSATELFSLMCREMKQAGTRTLIVDLRRCEGGNSAMAEILLYCLYGKDRLLSIEARQSEVLRCSPEYLERHPGVNLQDLSRRTGIPINAGDYVFESPCHSDSIPDSHAVRIRFETWAESMPTFYTEYISGRHSNSYLPENVYVLSSAYTFSSGFTLMYYLHRAGAKIVGIPSAQAGNCFGDVMGFELENSNLYFTVSSKYFMNFPDDTARGTVLIPDYPVSYEILASYDFDPNTSLLYALDLTQ